MVDTSRLSGKAIQVGIVMFLGIMGISAAQAEATGSPYNPFPEDTSGWWGFEIENGHYPPWYNHCAGGVEMRAPNPVPPKSDGGSSVSPASRLPGSQGGPTIDWGSAGLNILGTAGPVVGASVNGGAGYTPIFLGDGSSYVRRTDFSLPLNGIDWFHERVYASSGDGTPAWQGEQWWCNEMMNITGTAGKEDGNDCSVEMSPYWTLDFTNTSAGVWTTDDHYAYTLTYSSGNDEFLLTRADGYVWVFHDLNVANTAGMLKRIEDPYDNDWAFTYSGSDLDYITIDVVEGDDHKITYTYFTSGDNDGLLQYIKVYKSTTVSAANLIGQVEYVYHDSNSDGAEEFGSEDDLMKVIITKKGTSDGDGTLSIESTYRYRYYEGAYDSITNPGTDHELRYVLLPENAQRLSDDVGSPDSQSNSDWGDYANIAYEYMAGGQVRQTDERMPGSSCGCGGGTGATTTTYSWSANGGSPRSGHLEHALRSEPGG